MPADFFVRPMLLADVPDVERLTGEAYLDLDVRTRRIGWPPPEPRSPEQSRLWRARAEHVQQSDPRGCWVAEDGGGLLGVAMSMRRDLTWLLASYAVRPRVQGRGVGRRVLDAALHHGTACLRGMVAASEDPRAVRHYRLAGFDLHPTMLLRGRVPRAALPVVERVREGSLGDLDLMNSVDRQVRDAAHGVDHEFLARNHRMLVVDRPTGSGYAYVQADGATYLLAATSRRAAADLLWESLAASSPDVPVSVAHVSAANQWALDVATACALEVWTDGYLGLRGMKPPAPYLHSGYFL